ncbi:DNA-3-methyladenine glycosylase [Sinomonas sp. JGH33]|uniref:Putative 3-methyladenine DNA glycosylase n=1 Tax=Sinomonas terricola TaxID=3110330 RepID=A0ABU5T4B5_9MICC|nr:DNA-3-methyladenine glycosylase [Sinomonas sp. JGH33]MEA5454504.1 DNA-3-methyladenine glycosylase [Sinomonas sp. JGH33]
MHTLEVDFFNRSALDVAPDLLGAVLLCEGAAGAVAVRLTEVEAYLGEADPASHAYRGLTSRNWPMFGPPGHLYVYLSHGVHRCLNLVCGPDGTASGVLLRSGRVIDGVELARSRRPTAKADSGLASGPGNLGRVIGIGIEHSGAALAEHRAGLSVSIILPRERQASIMSGPRVGVSGEGGTSAYPWRFWVRDEPTVSRYRADAGRKAVAS